MEIVKKLKEYIIYKKRSGRYAVKDMKGKWVNGEPKRDILLAEGLIKLPAAKKVDEPEEKEETEAPEEAKEVEEAPAES